MHYEQKAASGVITVARVVRNVASATSLLLLVACSTLDVAKYRSFVDEYMAKPDHKAMVGNLVLYSFNWAWSYPSEEAAAEAALKRCRERDQSSPGDCMVIRRGAVQLVDVEAHYGVGSYASNDSGGAEVFWTVMGALAGAGASAMASSRPTTTLAQTRTTSSSARCPDPGRSGQAWSAASSATAASCQCRGGNLTQTASTVSCRVGGAQFGCSLTKDGYVSCGQR